MNGKPGVICGDISAVELRRLARREPDHAAAARMQVVAGALEGLRRAEAAPAGGYGAPSVARCRGALPARKATLATAGFTRGQHLPSLCDQRGIWV